MDTMGKTEFIRLHGEELFERIAIPILGDCHDDEYAIAGIHHRFPKRFIQEYPDRIKATLGIPRIAERVSFLEFKQRHVRFYGEKKWNKLLKLIYKKFDKWLSESSRKGN